MPSAEGKSFVLAGVVLRRLQSSEETGGQFCLFENASNGNTRTPIHVHSDDDETIYMIEGELTAVVDGEPRRLTPGESIFLPRGVPHQLMNMSGKPSRYLLIDTPPLFEQFLLEAGHELGSGEKVGPPTPEDIERLREAAPRFGVTLLPDWPKKSQP